MKSISLITKIILRKNILSPLSNIPLIFFPLAELFLFGYMNNVNGLHDNSTNTFIFGTMLWIATYRSQIEINSEVFDGISQGSLKAILCLPVNIVEYIWGVIISSLIRLLPTLIVFFALSECLFDFLSKTNTSNIILALINFIIFGWSIGVATSCFALIFGSKVNFFSWFSAVVLYPFMSTYYDASTMHFPFNVIGSIMPNYLMTKDFLVGNQISLYSFLVCLLINIFYLLIANFFLVISYKIALKRGSFYYQ